ncbi:hypothetical protein ACJX0J_025526, partial [Zea mays]
MVAVNLRGSQAKICVEMMGTKKEVFWGYVQASYMHHLDGIMHFKISGCYVRTNYLLYCGNPALDNDDRICNWAGGWFDLVMATAMA